MEVSPFSILAYTFTYRIVGMTYRKILLGGLKPWYIGVSFCSVFYVGAAYALHCTSHNSVHHSTPPFSASASSVQKAAAYTLCVHAVRSAYLKRQHFPICTPQKSKKAAGPLTHGLLI